MNFSPFKVRTFRFPCSPICRPLDAVGWRGCAIPPNPLTSSSYSHASVNTEMRFSDFVNRYILASRIIIFSSKTQTKMLNFEMMIISELTTKFDNLLTGTNKQIRLLAVSAFLPRPSIHIPPLIQKLFRGFVKISTRMI